MNQNEFFNILMDGLKDFPEIKLHDIISYYENNFVLELVSGKTEEEIITKLGNPDLIVNKYRTEALKTPINTGYFTTDVDITNIGNKNYINNSNFTTNNNFINADTFNDFKTNDIFNNNNSIENGFKTNNKFNTFKTSSSYDDINLSSDFYNLRSSNQSNYNFTVKSDFNHNNKDDFNYNSSNNFNSDHNSDSNSNSFNDENHKNKILKFNVNTILIICTGILALAIFFPVITGIIGCIIGLLGVAISIFLASIGVLVGGTFTSFIGLPNVPMFVANFPHPSLVLFSLGSISLSILLIFLFYYLFKFLIQMLIKIYNSIKSKGGSF
ncbi:transporter [Clostridium beijerinckii]|nr:transporter [Clostridium beijerinckii]